MKRRILQLIIPLLWMILIYTNAAPVDMNQINRLIQDFKKDRRGPYQAIRWFCPDGTVLLPQQRCPQPGGIQHALHKDIVQLIARENHIFLGQILAGTPFEDFLNEENQNSRFKQYQLEKYLISVDDGWIFRQARYYRGAVQAEDEDAWGFRFLNWMLEDDELLWSRFYVIRQLVKDIPHQQSDRQMVYIRSISKVISDSLPSFVDIRIKLHGQPEAADLKRIKDFRTQHQNEIRGKIDALFDQLEEEMERAYQPPQLGRLRKYLDQLPPSSPLYGRIEQLSMTADMGPEDLPSIREEMAVLLWDIRTNMLSLKSASLRLAIMDLSYEIENILFRLMGDWQPGTVGELLKKNYTLALSAAGCGLLEIWEWEQVQPVLNPQPTAEHLTLPDYLGKVDAFRRIVEWSTNTISAAYDPTVSLFSGFEPQAKGFIDDRVRSSLLLPLGNITDQLADISSHLKGLANDVLQLNNQSHMRGVNPGFAFGELEVVTSPAEDIAFSGDKIYALYRAPMNLKPVAGIMTVSEGNLVSHVQLLARNLGIPNAILSRENLKALTAYSGRKVFYAVSPGGAVIMKLAEQLSAEEKSLVERRKRSEERISVPVEKLKLKDLNLHSLKSLRADDSGRLCGPKAANLAELKYLFHDKVVDGFVIPFGIFHQHLQQMMPGTGQSYWEFLQETFRQASNKTAEGQKEEAIEKFVLERLAQLREAIKKITFTPDFESALGKRFADIFGVKMGKVPVFIRSDTNMEDLKEFTGAGLNLTVFNVLEKAKILQGIRDVWASPYSERSYRWRQKYLLNPENVYPSILIIPSVRVDKSGVMITKGVETNDPEDITIAFNRGAGGAVEGQKAEMHLLRHDGVNVLLSPCREVEYIVLPVTGGTEKRHSYFEAPVLNAGELDQLRKLADKIKDKLREQSIAGPYDVELGFEADQIWLFQVRPFVENKRAQSLSYFESIDARSPEEGRVFMGEKIENLMKEMKKP